MNRRILVPILGVALVGLSASAHAQSSWGEYNRAQYGERQSYVDSRRAAYDNGFREGAKQGGKDGRKRDVFAYQDERTFQRADKGYSRQYGDVERYRQSFRTGYAAGYSEAYERNAPGSRNGRYGDNGRRGNDRYGDNGRRGNGRYDTRQGYPGQGYPTQGGQYYTPAFDNGATDGYEKGAEDARKNRSFDVVRHEWYRDGERHYEGRYGSREQYKDVYREGFKEGYARGFREGRYRY